MDTKTPEDEATLSKIPAETNIELAVAEKATLSPWNRGYLKLYLICMLVYLNSTMSGYDSSLLASINALPAYQEYFNLSEPGVSTGLVFAIFQIGQMTGCLFIWVADWLGRRYCIFIGVLGIIIGTIIQGTCTTMSGFIGSRFVIAFFTTFAISGAPVYLVEIAPAANRGLVAGIYNTLYYMGSIIATFSVYGCSQHYGNSASPDLSWRIPVWLQLLCPSIVALGILFLPESPRWLIAKERYEEARAFVVKYHADGDETSPVVELEMEEMRKSVLENGGLLTMRTYFDLSVLYRTRSRRYRTFLNVCMSWFGQFSGNNVGSYYLPQIIKMVGITSTPTVLLMNAIYAIVGWGSALTGARLHDVFGRRKVLLTATLSMVLALSILSGTSAGYLASPTHAISSAAIFSIFLFGAIFAMGYTSMQPVYPGEVMTSDQRAKGMGLHFLVGGVAGFINTFAAPVAMRNIGWRFYLFFVGWDLLEAAVIYLWFVETKGASLEELQEVFESKNPRKESVKRAGERERAVKEKKASP